MVFQADNGLIGPCQMSGTLMTHLLSMNLVKELSLSDSNLHVVNYSQPVRRVMSLVELKKHIFTLRGSA